MAINRRVYLLTTARHILRESAGRKVLRANSTIASNMCVILIYAGHRKQRKGAHIKLNGCGTTVCMLIEHRESFMRNSNRIYISYY